MKASLNDKISTAKEKIIAFLTQQDITLLADEEMMLARWEAADRYLVEKKFTFQQIADKISTDFKVSRFTAQNDIFTAMEIFGQARKLDKRYALFLKYQRQEEDLDRIRKKMFNLEAKEGEEGWSIDAKQLQALAKLEEAITYTLNSIPQEAPPASVRTPVMIFNIANNKLAQPMTIEDAIIEADKMINANDSDV